MTVLASAGLPLDTLSIVTVDGGAIPAAPAWERMFGWPADGVAAVPLRAGSRAERTIWAARLDRAVREADSRVLLIADGLGCAASAWWARLSPAHEVRKIAGALLFAPAPDAGLFASPASHLPFPSLVIQPDGGDEEAREVVASWGSRLIVGGRVRNRGAAQVAWRQAQRLFLRLTHQMVEHDVARGRALTGWR